MRSVLLLDRLLPKPSQVLVSHSRHSCLLITVEGEFEVSDLVGCRFLLWFANREMIVAEGIVSDHDNT